MDAAGNGRFISRLHAKGEQAAEEGDCSYVRNDAATRQVWLMMQVESEPSLRSDSSRVFVVLIRLSPQSVALAIHLD